jgi:hypothetical protein
VSARHRHKHRRKRKPFTQNRELSKITVAVAGVTVMAMPAVVAAGMAASGGSNGHGSPLVAMAGSTPGALPAPAHLDTGIPITGAARAAVSLEARRVVAERAAKKAAEAASDRRAAELLADQQAAGRQADQRAAAKPAPAQQSSGTSGSTGSAPPQPSGSPQQIALAMLGSYGWSSSQFGCLQSLWNVESGWNVYASNPSSGAYGIPQALPGSKMASAGPDWQSNAATQIRWGLGYIQSMYGSPCGAWAHEQANGWY